MFYNKRAWLCQGDEVEKDLEGVLYYLEYIFVVFLFLLILCAPRYISSTEYVDSLDLGIELQENSQYWIPPFVIDFLKKNLELIDANCYEYLKNETCMEL